MFPLLADWYHKKLSATYRKKVSGHTDPEKALEKQELTT